jgi:KRAB domain-containing zinc finger protein
MKSKHLEQNDKFGIYKCTLCEMEYIKKGHLCRHMFQIHNTAVEEHLPCGICNEIHKTKCSLRKHIRIKHSNKIIPVINHDVVKNELFNVTYKCKVCFRIEPTLSKFRKHLISHSIIRPFKCEICKNVSYKEKSSLKVHYKLIHSKNKLYYKCKFCKRDEFLDKKDLKNHILHKHLKSKLKCNMCLLYFVDQKGFGKHIKSPHIDPNQIKHLLEIDTKQLTSNKIISYLDEIKYPSVTKKGEYLCEICRKSYISKEIFKKHHDKFHGKKKNYTCKFCRNCFTYKSSFKKHFYINHGVQIEIKCNFCKKVFINDQKAI